MADATTKKVPKHEKKKRNLLRLLKIIEFKEAMKFNKIECPQFNKSVRVIMLTNFKFK